MHLTAPEDELPYTVHAWTEPGLAGHLSARPRTWRCVGPQAQAGAPASRPCGRRVHGGEPQLCGAPLRQPTRACALLVARAGGGGQVPRGRCCQPLPGQPPLAPRATGAACTGAAACGCARLAPSARCSCGLPAGLGADTGITGHLPAHAPAAFGLARSGAPPPEAAGQATCQGGKGFSARAWQSTTP